MPGGRGTETRKLPCQVLVRLTPAAAAAVRALASERGLTDAAWVRDVVATAAALPPDDRCPEAPRRRRPLPPEDVAAVSRLSLWLNRHNGALVQLAKAVRERGALRLHARIEAELASIEAVAADLRRLADGIREAEEVETR